jgi:two-component system sensor histidine kinase DesK
MLKAAEINLAIVGDPSFNEIPTIVEGVLSMCLKEAVTNVVKHSEGTSCRITFEQLANEFVMIVEDNGIGMGNGGEAQDGSGLRGMRERLEFVNGSLQIGGCKGTRLMIRVPVVLKHIVEEAD